MDENFAPTQKLAGMTLWACSYDGSDGRYCINLYGTNADQVLEDNCDVLPGLTVDGEHMGTIPFNQKT